MTGSKTANRNGTPKQRKKRGPDSAHRLRYAEVMEKCQIARKAAGCLLAYLQHVAQATSSRLSGGRRSSRKEFFLAFAYGRATNTNTHTHTHKKKNGEARRVLLGLGLQKFGGYRINYTVTQNPHWWMDPSISTPCYKDAFSVIRLSPPQHVLGLKVCVGPFHVAILTVF